MCKVGGALTTTHKTCATRKGIRIDIMKLDQFFTTEETAMRCLGYLNCRLPTTDQPIEFIEPSAGDGVFYNLLPKGRRIGIDLAPQHPDIERANFLKWRPEAGDSAARVVIGNPPFGKRGSIAVEFLRHASEIADTVGFIVPMCFRKYAIQRKLPSDLKLVWQTKLGKAFRLPDGRPYEINTEFQVWTRSRRWTKDLRVMRPEPISHDHFIMHQYNNTRKALRVFDLDFDFAVPCQGWQDYSRRESDPANCEKNKQWMLLKGRAPRYLKNLIQLDYNQLAMSTATTVPGFRKCDLVAEYQSHYG